MSHKTQKQDTGQIPSPSNKAGDHTSSQSNSGDPRQDIDEQMPDQAQTMNQRSRKSAEEYNEIQKKARQNPQEPGCLRSCSKK